jgi:hypothetical protein
VSSVGLRRKQPNIFSRVCEVKLMGDHQFEVKQQKYKVSDELKKGEARVLFGEFDRAGPGEGG